MKTQTEAFIQTDRQDGTKNLPNFQQQDERFSTRGSSHCTSALMSVNDVINYISFLKVLAEAVRNLAVPINNTIGPIETGFIKLSDVSCNNSHWISKKKRKK